MEIFLSLGPRYALSYLYVHLSTNNSLQYSRIALNVNYTIAKNVSQQNIKNNNFFEVNTQFNVKLKKKKMLSIIVDLFVVRDGNVTFQV